MKPPTQLTAGHRELHRKLNVLGLILEDEVRVGKYVVDTYCRDYHLAFEFDGPMHEALGKRRKDEERDKWLFYSAGLPVMRVSAESLRDSDFEQSVQDWVIHWCITLDDRLQLGALWPLVSLV